MADMKKLAIGGNDGGNVLVANVHGGPGQGVAEFVFPKDYTAGKTLFVPFLGPWDNPKPPVVFLQGQTADAVKLGPLPGGVVEVAQLVVNDLGEDEEVGRLRGLAVDFTGTPKAGSKVRVGYLLVAEQ